MKRGAFPMPAQQEPASKPVCKVRGMIEPRAMCGYVIVGMKYCGFKGDCEHKSVAEMIVQMVKDFPAPIR